MSEEEIAVPKLAVVDAAPEENQLSTGTDPLEIMAVRLFTQRLSGRFRFNVDKGSWYEFDGKRWREDALERAQYEMIELVDRMRRQDPTKRAALGKMSFARNALWGASKVPELAVRAVDFDADPYLLGTPAGYIDLRTGTSHKPDPTKMISKVTLVMPKKGKPKRWLEFMEFATGKDQELLKYLQKFFGYSLSGLMHEEIMTFIYGPGGNGKGVMISALGRIWGDYYKSAPSSAFMESKYQQHSTEIARLAGARLITSSEIGEDDKWNMTRIKEITGNEAPMSARFMRQDDFDFWPTFKLMFVGNSKPAFGEIDAAISRRLRLIDFNQTPPKVDKGLKEALAVEYPSILQWCLEGFLLYQKEGLTPPKSVTMASSAYINAEDTIGAFIREWLTFDFDNPQKHITNAELREALFVYSRVNATGRALSAKRLYKALTEVHGLVPNEQVNRVRAFKCVTFQEVPYKILMDYRMKQAVRGTENAPET